MNTKQITRLIVALILVAVVGWLLVSKDNQSWNQGEASIGGAIMPELSINDIQKMTITDAEGAVTLLKEEETWRVSERSAYAADFAKIRDLLIQIADTKILRPMKVGESQLGRLELQVPGEGDKSGTLLTFFAEGETPQAKLLLGKQSMKKSEASSFGGGEFPDGRYIMVDGDMQRISQVSETFSAVTTEPKQWLDKTFFKVEKLQSVSVTHPDVTNNWSVSRESDSGDMVLAGLAEGEEMDSSRTYSLKNVLSSPSFNDIVGGEVDQEALGMDQAIKAELKTFDGFAYTVELGSPNEDEEYPVRVGMTAEIAETRVSPEEESDEDKERLDKEHAEQVAKLKEKLEAESGLAGKVFWVSKWTVDTLLKVRSELIKQPEDELTEETADPSAPEIQIPGLEGLTNPLGLEGQ